MSDVPLARKIIEELLHHYPLDRAVRVQLRQALLLMHREGYVRRAPAKRTVIDKHMRRRVRLLVNNTDLTMHQIAEKVGLRSSGRVSEVMHGKR